MDRNIFEGDVVTSKRILHTPSEFARQSLIYLQEAGSLTAKKRYTSRREHLSSYLCFLVKEGSGILSYSGREYPVGKGNLVFIDCTKPYSHTTSEDLWTLSWIHVGGYVMKGIYEKYRERGGLPVLRPKNAEAYDQAIDDIYSLASKELYVKDMKLCTQILRLLTMLMEDAWDENPVNTGERTARDLTDLRLYLDESFDQRLTLDSLAERFFINKYYMTRLFKEQFGISIMDYITRKRITHAKRELRFSEKTAAQIGVECGIEDANYFSRIFKKIEGVSPGRYRQLWNS